MSKRNLHVVPADGGWAVRREHSERATSIHPTQGAAIGSARGHAERDQVEVVIHRPNGQIRDKDSSGPDPFPPRDKKH